MFEKMAENITEVDLICSRLGIARGDIVVEFAQRYQKPVAVVPESLCMIAECVSAIKAKFRRLWLFDLGRCCQAHESFAGKEGFAKDKCFISVKVELK